MQKRKHAAPKKKRVLTFSHTKKDQNAWYPFGRFAGMAGMVDTTLWLAQFYRDDCSSTPFLSSSTGAVSSFKTVSLDGERIYEGLSGENQEPLAFTVTASSVQHMVS
jgi:hypothetical protein